MKGTAMFNFGTDGVAYSNAALSGGGAATALSVANEIAQLLAALVAIVAGLASLVHFLRQRKK